MMSDTTGYQTSLNNGPGDITEESISTFDGEIIEYHMRGNGNTTLIFIHGWCSNRSFWREQLDVFADKYRVVAIDLPGHGSSSRTRKEWSLSSFADDVIALVESLNLKRVVLIGHSMGGLVWLEVAQRLPKRIIGVIGVDTISDVENEDQPDLMERIITAFKADFEGTMKASIPRLFSQNATPELVLWAIDNSVNADHVMALSIIREVSGLDEKKLLSAVDVPVRVVYSAKSNSSEAYEFVKTNSKYADFKAVFVQGVGHFLHLENPEKVNHHLRIFLTELEQSGTAN